MGMRRWDELGGWKGDFRLDSSVLEGEVYICEEFETRKSTFLVFSFLEGFKSVNRLKP